MAQVAVIGVPPGSTFQAPGTQTWTWAIGDRDFYWGLAVQPFQANSRVRLEGPITSISDNNLNQTKEFVVTMASSGLLHFTAIQVKPT